METRPIPQSEMCEQYEVGTRCKSLYSQKTTKLHTVQSSADVCVAMCLLSCSGGLCNDMLFWGELSETHM